MHILIADDEPSSRFILEDALTEWGYKVTSVDNGNDAIKSLFMENPPRLCILDWLMPGHNGIEVIQSVRGRPEQPFTYCILLTSKTDTSDVVNGLSSGADDFLCKPTSMTELRSRIEVGERIINYEKELQHKEFNSRLECYRAITDLAEARDNETGEHLKRISAFSRILGTGLGLPQKDIQDLIIFSPLHDIGKVGIPDNILLAPRKLTKDEFAIMKTHTSLGHDILTGRLTLEVAAEIAHFHHENFDGSGYPQKLAGGDIPIKSHIVKVADVYDALRSERPYKKPWSHEQARDQIVAGRNTDFDPQLVDIFIKHEKEFERISQELRKPSLKK